MTQLHFSKAHRGERFTKLIRIRQEDWERIAELGAGRGVEPAALATFARRLLAESIKREAEQAA